MADQFDAEVPTAWFDLSLLLVQQTAGFSPPVAGRAFAHAGVVLYEALVPGMPDHRSLAGHISGLSELPGAGKNPVFHWPTVANSSLAAILRSLFPTAPAQGGAAIDSMEARFAAQFRPGLPPGVYRRSVDRGQQVAAAVFEWSEGDGGHESYLIFPKWDVARTTRGGGPRSAPGKLNLDPSRIQLDPSRSYHALGRP